MRIQYVTVTYQKVIISVRDDNCPYAIRAPENQLHHWHRYYTLPNDLSFLHKYMGGTRWRSWLRHCATSRKVAGSIPDGVIGFFSLT